MHSRGGTRPRRKRRRAGWSELRQALAFSHRYLLLFCGLWVVWGVGVGEVGVLWDG